MTEIEWMNVDEALIERIKALGDYNLVQLLWAGDDAAWRYVFAMSVIPVTRRRTFQRILQDRSRSALDVCAAVMNRLLAERKLEIFDYRCPIVHWIRYWVIKDILVFCEKNDNPKPWSAGEEESFCDGFSNGLDWWLADEIDWCFQRLSALDSLKATVLRLRAIEGMSAGQVMEKLGITSVDNVNQIYSRAVKLMREIRKQSQKYGGF